MRIVRNVLTGASHLWNLSKSSVLRYNNLKETEAEMPFKNT